MYLHLLSEKKIICEVSISIQKQQHLLGVLRGLLLSLNQHHRLQLATSTLVSAQGMVSRD